MLQIETKTDYFGQLLKWVRDHRAQIDRPFRIRRGNKLEPIPEDVFPVLNHDEMMAGLEEFFSTDIVEGIRSGRETDFHFEYFGNCHRAHFGRQQSQVYFSFRAITPVMFGLKDLQLPTSMRDVIRDPSGLVLFAGPRGHAKGNAARAALREFLEKREARVISIEEPMKYVLPEGKSQVLQREVGWMSAR